MKKQHLHTFEDRTSLNSSDIASPLASSGTLATPCYPATTEHAEHIVGISGAVGATYSVHSTIAAPLLGTPHVASLLLGAQAIPATPMLTPQHMEPAIGTSHISAPSTAHNPNAPIAEAESGGTILGSVSLQGHDCV